MLKYWTLARTGKTSLSNLWVTSARMRDFQYVNWSVRYVTLEFSACQLAFLVCQLEFLVSHTYSKTPNKPFNGRLPYQVLKVFRSKLNVFRRKSYRVFLGTYTPV